MVDNFSHSETSDRGANALLSGINFDEEQKVLLYQVFSVNG